MKSLSTHNVLIKLRISSLIKLSIVCGQSWFPIQLSRPLPDHRINMRGGPLSGCICTWDIYFSEFCDKFLGRCSYLLHLLHLLLLLWHGHNCPKYHPKNLNLLKFISCPAENWTISRPAAAEEHGNICQAISDRNRFSWVWAATMAIKTTTHTFGTIGSLAGLWWWRSLFFCLLFPAIKRTQFDRMWEREKERGKGKEQQQQLVSFRENQPRTRGNIMAAATEYNNADRAVQSTLNKNFNWIRSNNC